MDYKKLNERETEENSEFYNESLWTFLPDAVLLQIFSYLDHKQLLRAGLVCKTWNSISYDDFLWRDLFHKDFKVNSTLYSCMYIKYFIGFFF